MIFDFLSGVENLFHLIEQFVVLIFHLTPRGRVDPHCLVAINEVVYLETVGLIDFDPIMGDHVAYTEKETKELYNDRLTVLISLVEPKPLYDSWMERGISSSLLRVIQGCLSASFTLYLHHPHHTSPHTPFSISSP